MQLESQYFIKRVILIVLFFTITPITLFASIISLISVTRKNIANTPGSESYTLSSKTKNQVYAASDTSSFPSTSSQIVAGDARVEIVSDYLKANNSELTPYANLIVEAADKYGLDFRLLPAIAQKESGLCRVIPEGSHNCWGWGIHSKGTLTFDSYEEAIETVSKGLRENYINKGYVTPDQIMKKYAHPDSTTWAEGVSYYMSQME